jgi:hypothetical protein
MLEHGKLNSVLWFSMVRAIASGIVRPGIASVNGLLQAKLSNKELFRVSAA